MICFKEFSTNYFYFFVPFFYMISKLYDWYLMQLWLIYFILLLLPLLCLLTNSSGDKK